MKTLCDLFNDAAEVQTELYKVDVDTLNAQGFTWMLHRLHILLHKMPLKEEIVTIETWPSGIDRLFALRDYRMFREDGEELVRATSEWMYIDMKRRRPLRLPENVIAMSTEHNIPKLVLAPLLDEKEFGGHVTQASYVRWITNSLPFGFLKEHVLTEIEVIYAHEIMPDSQIHSAYRMEERGENEVVVWHEVKDETEHLTHCQAKTVWMKQG